MPAAAVIPAPEAYAKVVAVKKLVVEFLAWATGAIPEWGLIVCVALAIFLMLFWYEIFHCNQSRVFQAGRMTGMFIMG